MMAREQWYRTKEIHPKSKHCMKSFRIGSFCGPYFPAFRLNTDQRTPDTDTFHAVKSSSNLSQEGPMLAKPYRKIYIF